VESKGQQAYPNVNSKLEISEGIAHFLCSYINTQRANITCVNYKLFHVIRAHVLEKENKSVTRGKIHLLKIRGMLSFHIIVLLCYKANSVCYRMLSFHFVGLAFHIPNHFFPCAYLYLYFIAEKNYLKLTLCIIIVYYGPFHEKFQMMFALNKKSHKIINIIIIIIGSYHKNTTRNTFNNDPSSTNVSYKLPIYRH
jgi:hypothetical protein